MLNLSSKQLKDEFAEFLNRVEYQREVIVVMRHKRHSAVILSRGMLVDMFGHIDDLINAASLGGETPSVVNEINALRKKVTYSGWFERDK